ncbi:hypothetical protein C2845_PM13G20580 [Panicum miliaceum]|uniref:Uncharacterized protein n=1 Tax=Panicum miliaceum TaxID=4540 RepID=A0A3L6RHH6_PANMI|nr:hypothetical protein C2845_PM13G20580 [Panicum miliaceum]
MDDVNRFVASKVLQHMASEKKRKIADAVSKVLSGVSELLGTFIQDMVETEDSSGPDLRRSKRRRTTKPHRNYDDDEEEEDDVDEDSDYDEDEEEWISSSEDGSDQDPENEDDQQQEEQEDDEEEEVEEEDLVPLRRRLRRMQSDTSIAGKGKTPSASDSIGGEPTLQANGNTRSEAQL